MANIKVIKGGCGIQYTDAHGNPRHALKTAESGPFQCDDAQASRLVGLGVAAYVDAEPDKPQDIGHLDEGQLETMTVEQLKALAGDLGADTTGCRKKADYIAAILAAEVEPGDDEDGDELPDLSAADPE